LMRRRRVNMVQIDGIMFPILSGAIGATVGAVALDEPGLILLAPLFGGLAAYLAGILTPRAETKAEMDS